MKKELTNSNVDRQNILNNPYALDKIQAYIGFDGMMFEGEFKYTKSMVTDFYGVDERTIERYLDSHSAEFKHNGYVIMKGKQLNAFKSEFSPIINIGSKTTQLGVFNFRAFLNLGMLLTESDSARVLRSKLLDIVIQVVNEKTGGGTKYINQRDAYYLTTAAKETGYRKKFTTALNLYVDMGRVKYSLYTDAIYRCIFRENAKEYKNILKLEDKDNPRDTFYSEVLTLISSFESGLAYELEKRSKAAGRKLSKPEVDQLIENFSNHPLQIPFLEDARIKMASRDYYFRDAFHLRLEEYVKSIPVNDFEKFLGEQSKSLERQLEDAQEVLKRLKGNE
ncbi:MAG: DNA-binding protein [Chlorobi bacterium]|nr:DNA-binding protein [Chlorobiota bacterium]